jgi:hypothetical protein
MSRKTDKRLKRMEITSQKSFPHPFRRWRNPSLPQKIDKAQYFTQNVSTNSYSRIWRSFTHLRPWRYLHEANDPRMSGRAAPQQGATFLRVRLADLHACRRARAGVERPPTLARTLTLASLPLLTAGNGGNSPSVRSGNPELGWSRPAVSGVWPRTNVERYAAPEEACFLERSCRLPRMCENLRWKLDPAPHLFTTARFLISGTSRCRQRLAPHG